MTENKVHLVPALLCRIPGLDWEGEFPEGIVSVAECGITIIERNSLPEEPTELLEAFPRLAWIIGQFAQHPGVDFMIVLDEDEPDNKPAVQGQDDSDKV